MRKIIFSYSVSGVGTSQLEGGDFPTPSNFFFADFDPMELNWANGQLCHVIFLVVIWDTLLWAAMITDDKIVLQFLNCT